MEGYLESCLGSECPASCCSRGYGESLQEFLNSYRGQNQDKLKELGIDFEIRGDMVWFQNCTDGTICKILEYMGDGQDVRGLNCKIFPYKHGWVQQGDERNPAIYLKSCPATKPGHSVPIEFTNQVIGLVKEHYFKITGSEVKVQIVDPPQEA